MKRKVYYIEISRLIKPSRQEIIRKIIKSLGGKPTTLVYLSGKKPTDIYEVRHTWAKIDRAFDTSDQLLYNCLCDECNGDYYVSDDIRNFCLKEVT